MDDAYREFHGIRVPDPHRWLQRTEDEPVRSWVQAQQERTDEYLRDCSEIHRCREFLERNQPLLAPDWTLSRGGREFRLVRRAGKSQPLLVVQEAAGPERVLVDPNADGKVLQHDNLSVSPSGRYLAYTLSGPAGIPVHLHVCEVASGRLLESSRCITAVPLFAWHPQEQGFFYSLFRRLFDDDGSGDARKDGLYWHALGADWSRDPCIREYHDARGHLCFAIVPERSEHVLICNFHFSSGRSGASLCRLQDVDLSGRRPPETQTLFEELEGYNLFLGQVRDELYFHTCRDAPRGRIVAIHVQRPQAAQWRIAVPEAEQALARPERFPGPLRSAVSEQGLLVGYVRDAANVLRHYSLDGSPGPWLEPQPLCTLDSVSASAAGFRVSAQSFLLPRIVYETAAGSAELRETQRTPLPLFDAGQYELSQEFYHSQDGTRIPIFLLQRKGLVRDGSHPTLLYAYGGFNQAITPEFSPEIALWLELGGLYALANIRGGGEYGEAWARAGSGVNKQNCFDDFYAAAEYLVEQGYTQAARLAIRGLSNGGLLTAVAANQRPELFAAVISEVPLVDMLWLDETAAGQSLGSEYGNPYESKAVFELLHRYSPLQNVHAHCPPQMVVIAEQDFSAPPAQAYRYVAARQAANPVRGPVLLRTIAGEGHTGWKPENTRRVLAEEVAFLRQALGVARPLRQPDRVGLRMPMRDGVRLSANIWLPQQRPCAAVLLRTPYGSDAAEFQRLGLHDYVEAGYAVVMQSVRGRGASEGSFGFFRAEGQDGYDSIEWLAAQDWCNGKVAMDGGSYLGTAQWLAAREQPPHLSCIMPAVPAGDWFNEIPYMGGALQVDWAFSWLGSMAGLAFDFDASGEKNLQKFRPLQNAEAVLGVTLPSYQELLAHPQQDDWWRPLQFSAADFAAIRIPVFTVTGWFDGDQAGSMLYWQGLQQHSRAPAQLVVGPWEHRECYLGGSGRLGEMEFGPASVLPLRQLRLEFLRRHLGAADRAPPPRAQIFVTGANRWHRCSEYPPKSVRSQSWYLDAGGRLGREPGSGAPDQYSYDPLDPVPYRGGALDHADLERRGDVLIYTSAVLERPLTVMGAVELLLHAASSAPDTDFTAKLLDVLPDGRSLSLTHVGGVLRARYRKGFERAELLTPGEPAEFRFRLSHAGHCFQPGHRIRLMLSSSCFPMIDPNTNTGADFRTDTGHQIAQQTIYHDAQRPSQLLLPVLPE